MEVVDWIPLIVTCLSPFFPCLHAPLFSLLHYSTAMRKYQTLQPTCQRVWDMELVLTLGKNTLSLVARVPQRYNQVSYFLWVLSSPYFILLAH